MEILLQTSEPQIAVPGKEPFINWTHFVQIHFDQKSSVATTGLSQHPQDNHLCCIPVTIKNGTGIIQKIWVYCYFMY